MTFFGGASIGLELGESGEMIKDDEIRVLRYLRANAIQRGLASVERNLALAEREMRLWRGVPLTASDCDGLDLGNPGQAAAMRDYDVESWPYVHLAPPRDPSLREALSRGKGLDVRRGQDGALCIQSR